MGDFTVSVPLAGVHGRGKFMLTTEAALGELRAMSSEALRVTAQGYAALTVKGRTRTVHRLLTGALEGQLVDHINGNKLDNRPQNLRLCNDAENSRNSRPQRGRLYKGVFWHPLSRRWIARIGVGEKTHNLGTFEDPAKAAEVYDAKAIELFGDFARLNFQYSPTQYALAYLNAVGEPRWRIISPAGEVFEVENMAAFCREHGLQNSEMSMVASGYSRGHHGWKCERLPTLRARRGRHLSR